MCIEGRERSEYITDILPIIKPIVLPTLLTEKWGKNHVVLALQISLFIRNRFMLREKSDTTSLKRRLNSHRTKFR